MDNSGQRYIVTANQYIDPSTGVSLTIPTRAGELYSVAGGYGAAGSVSGGVYGSTSSNVPSHRPTGRYQTPTQSVHEIESAMRSLQISNAQTPSTRSSAPSVQEIETALHSMLNINQQSRNSQIQSAHRVSSSHSTHSLHSTHSIDSQTRRKSPATSTENSRNSSRRTSPSHSHDWKDYFPNQERALVENQTKNAARVTSYGNPIRASHQSNWSKLKSTYSRRRNALM